MSSVKSSIKITTLPDGRLYIRKTIGNKTIGTTLTREQAEACTKDILEAIEEKENTFVFR